MPTLSGAVQTSYCSTTSSVTSSIISSSYNSVTYNADLSKIQFQSNTYEANFYTGGKSLVHLEGAPIVYFNSETFTNNGDNTKDIIDKYGSGIIVPASVSHTEITIAAVLASPATYGGSTLGQSLITVKRTYIFSYNDLKFTNNWKLETDYTTRP